MSGKYNNLRQIKSIQRGTITVNGATSNTATITAVNTAKTVLNFCGFSAGSDNMTQACLRIALTNSTTITATKAVGTSDAYVSYEAVEFF